MRFKLTLIVFMSLILSSIMIWAEHVEPNFQLLDIDEYSKSGEFVFGGVKQPFRASKNSLVVGRNGWAILTESDSIMTIFKLCKNGKYIKDIEIVYYPK